LLILLPVSPTWQKYYTFDSLCLTE